MNALSALVRTDLALYFRNRRALLITVAAPILIAAFFGAVLGGSPRKPSRIPIAVVDLDRSQVSRRIVQGIRDDSTFDVKEAGDAAAIEGVRSGKLRAGIVLPEGFGAAAPRAMFEGGAKPAITIHVDPSQSMTLAMVKGLLARHVMQAVSPVKFDMPFTTQEHEVTAGERKYNAYAHSFAGMGVQFLLFMGIELGVGVLHMRRLGLWKRLRAAPLSRGMLLGSRILSGTIIALILLALIYAAGMAIFGVRVEGSWPGFIAVLVGFGVMTSTFGLLIAAVGRTPEATRGLAILVTLILVMLGGAWVPTFVFPEWLQTATLVVPTRWAVDGLDAMTWRGLGLDAALLPAGLMLACSAAFALIAWAAFKWEE